MKKTFAFLFALTIIYSGIDQWLVLQTQAEIGSPDGAGPMTIFYIMLTLILGILYPVASSLFVFAILKKSDSPFAFFKDFSQSLIENLRAWGKSLLWSFLLIIPGIIKYVQYFFVTFVVCLDPAYRRGEVDALERSKMLTKGRVAVFLGLLVIFDAIFPLIFSLFDDWSMFSRTPIQALALCFVEMLINFCFIWILWRIYESTISMERNQNP